MKILETPRFYLREMTPDDAKNAYRLNADWENIRYTGDEAFESPDAARRFLENYHDYRLHGMGRWAVVDKQTDEYMGWCGIKYSPALDEYDIGYRFFKEYWNRGIATEVAQACIEYGFTELGLKNIVGRAMKENTASIRVLEKIGLRFLEEFIEDGKPHVKYGIVKADLDSSQIRG